LANLGGPFCIFLLGTLTNKFMNPENHAATISVKEGDRVTKYFDERVTDNFSGFWFWMGVGSIMTG
jgi:hypothetical protein